MFYQIRWNHRAIIAVAVALPCASDAALPENLGWHELPNTRLRALCPSYATYPEIVGGSGCAAVTQAWGGAAFDEAGNRLLITGGGHADWGGNEVYELDLDTQLMRRLNNPSYPVRDGCINNSTYADGLPVSRHTYNHLEYIPVVNLLLMYGGSRWQCGWFGNDTWTFNPGSYQWTHRVGPNAMRADFGVGVVRDPRSGLLYARDNNDLHSYDPTLHQWTQRSTDGISISSYKQAVIDPQRRRYYLYIAGDRHLYWHDISSTTSQPPLQSANTTGCGFMDSDAVGWAYDPVLDKLVAWDGGDAVQLLDPDSLTCATLSHPGGPTRTGTGTYGRFRYAPNSGVYVSCNRIDDNCHVLRLTPARIFADGFQ